MKHTFFKYHGTGNDFIMVDDRAVSFPVTLERIAHLCHRRFGIGADGLILIQPSAEGDFTMVYFNSDGNQSTMCGNGGRCAIKFAHDIGLIADKCSFMAIDGLHEGFIEANGTVHLRMIDTTEAVPSKGAWFINTGSPHHVTQVNEVENVAVDGDGRTLRESYGQHGSNINFVEVTDAGLHVRTYERGVEAETLSCGTGVTASALTAYQLGWVKNTEVAVKTPGGSLRVHFNHTQKGFENVWLIGPAVFVFTGEIDLP
jgi:diaminopimelate epimerase